MHTALRNFSSLARERSPERGGVVIVWLLLLVPAIAVLIIMLTDLANVWLARIELKNALDAAALSAAKTWGDGGTTLQARQSANTAFSNNTILGQTYSLSTAEGGCLNNNVTSGGEILLGSVEDVSPGFEFDCSGTPTCITGSFIAEFEILTATGDTFATPSGFPDEVFRLTQFTQTGGPSPLYLESIRIDLQPMLLTGSVLDNGYFDRRAAGSSDPQDGNGGPLIGLDDAGVGGVFAFSVFTEPPIPGGGPPGPLQPKVMTVTFGGLGLPSDTMVSPNQFWWGTDTDRVGFNIGVGGGVVAPDFGGDFGQGNAANMVIRGADVTITVSGSPFTGELLYDHANRSYVSFNEVLTGTGAYGARARKTVQVNSIGSAWLGIGTQYDVTAESFARYRCNGGPPQLVHIETFTCACP